MAQEGMPRSTVCAGTGQPMAEIGGMEHITRHPDYADGPQPNCPDCIAEGRV